MVKYVVSRLFGWMSIEPVVGLLMIIAAVVLFIQIYRKKKAEKDITFWHWMRNLVEAFAISLLFLGLLWSFRAILNNNYKRFQTSHGRISQVNYRSLKTIWGSPHVQRELSVAHWMEKEVKEEIRRNDPSLPPIYKVVTRRFHVPQNSVLSSRGEIKIIPNKRKKGSAYYSGYEAEFKMEYEIINDSEHRTEAFFNFPRSYGQALTENFNIAENGQNISRSLRFAAANVTWSRFMNPGEKIKISISYSFRGVEYFYYQIPQPREIRDFVFKATIMNMMKSELNYPEGCLTPKKITRLEGGKGLVLEWTLDRAVTTAGMGLKLPQPEQPGEKVTRVLKNSPYALMMLVVSISLIFIIMGYNIDFLRIALLSASYTILFVIMASVSDFFIGFWGSLVLGAAAALFLTYLLYRKHEDKLVRNLVLAISGFFTLIYPLSGLLTDYQESFNGIVTIVIMGFLFFVSLYSRMKQKPE